MTTVGWPEVYPRDPHNPAHANLLDWVFTCSELGCTYRTAHRTEPIAQKDKALHRRTTCPFTEGAAMPAGKSILEQLWSEMDDTMDYLIDTAAEKGTEKYCQFQGRAQGLAKAIFLISHPSLQQEKEVGIWAGRRKKMRAGTLEHMDTPGVDVNVLPPSTREVTKAKAAAPAAVVSTPTGLTPEQTSILENGLNANLPHSSLAKLVKLSVAQVDAYAQSLAAAK